MDLDDFKKPEVAVTAAATAALLSPAARHLLHRGVVYGVAGVLLAGRTLGAAGRGAAKGFQAASGVDAAGTGRATEPVAERPPVEEVPADAPAAAPHSEEPIRDLVRKGAVYGATGARLVSDTLAAAGRGAARGLRSAKEAATGDSRLPTSERRASPDTEHRDER